MTSTQFNDTDRIKDVKFQLYEYGMTTRGINALIRNLSTTRINAGSDVTVGDVRRAADDDLLTIRNLGIGSLATIRRVLGQDQTIQTQSRFSPCDACGSEQDARAVWSDLVLCRDVRACQRRCAAARKDHTCTSPYV